MTRTPGNLIDSATRGTRIPYDVVSPVTGNPLDRVVLATREEIADALVHLSGPPRPLPTREVFAFLERLKDQLLLHREQFFEKTTLETGFIARDSAEIVGGAVEFLMDFEAYVQEQPSRKQVIRHSYSSGCHRDMRITHRPYRCVAAVVPQNASLSLGITIIASALYAGARVLLRPSLQSASTGALLAEVLAKSEPPDACVEVVNCLASDFLAACYGSDHVDAIHYIGSNQYALPVFNEAFAAGKVCILDGQGNGMLYVDGTFPVEDAVRIITSGATRFNGETCTSVNGVLVEEGVYPALRDALVSSFENLRVGHPLSPESEVGPLFSERQALGLRRALLESPEGRILCGGDVGGAYFEPAVLEGVREGDEIVREGLFGPAIWIQSVSEETLWGWLRSNRFPLSDTVLSNRKDLVRAVAANSRAARICVNEDPSVESMFEPWGGYPPSGLNPVSIWTEKYRQTYQLDGKLKEILTIPADLRGGEA